MRSVVLFFGFSMDLVQYALKLWIQISIFIVFFYSGGIFYYYYFAAWKCEIIPYSAINTQKTTAQKIAKIYWNIAHSFALQNLTRNRVKKSGFAILASYCYRKDKQMWCELRTGEPHNECCRFFPFDDLRFAPWLDFIKIQWHWFHVMITKICCQKHLNVFFFFALSFPECVYNIVHFACLGHR